MNSPARILASFLLALPAGMLLAAVAAPWVHAAIAPLGSFPLHRVFSRLTMLGVSRMSICLGCRTGHH